LRRGKRRGKLEREDDLLVRLLTRKMAHEGGGPVGCLFVGGMGVWQGKAGREGRSALSLRTNKERVRRDQTAEKKAGAVGVLVDPGRLTLHGAQGRAGSEKTRTWPRRKKKLARSEKNG